MNKCPQCLAELSETQPKCPACGLSIFEEPEATAVLPADPQANTPTELSNPSSRNKTHSTTGGGARFVSGTVLAGRYRIVGLIGKGGMGEVYKADDLELDQAVALKFLPEELSKNEDLLRRFRGEVRNARQVSHRNVCRVFDIGEIEGLYYLTMEYIDGDDLSMPLKRIGRLPSDKAVEISRDISMGLAAIHGGRSRHPDCSYGVRRLHLHRRGKAVRREAAIGRLKKGRNSPQRHGERRGFLERSLVRRQWIYWRTQISK